MYCPRRGLHESAMFHGRWVSPFCALCNKALPCLVERAGFEPTSLLLQTTNGWLATVVPVQFGGRSILVALSGVEPAWLNAGRLLRPLCLPVSPQSHVVRVWGVEPQRISPREPKSRLSTNSIIPACRSRFSPNHSAIYFPVRGISLTYPQ